MNKKALVKNEKKTREQAVINTAKIRKHTPKQEPENLTLLNGFSQKKKSFLSMFPELFGNISKTAESIGIDRGTYYHWIRTDKEFKQAIEDLQPKRIIIDLAKSKLIEAVEQGNITAIIFTLKTIGKDEGFSERAEIVNLNKNIDADIDRMTDEEIRAEIKRLSYIFENIDKPLIITVENEEQKRIIEKL